MGFQKGHKLNIGNQYAKGNKHTDQWKKEAEKRMLGNQYAVGKGHRAWNKGLPAWNKGLKMPTLTGSNNPRWKGGKSRDIHSLHNPKYCEWRNKVFSRDNYTCRINNSDCCGILQAHHILRWADYPELRYATNNGITLCKNHHPRKKADESRLVPFFMKLLCLDVTRSNLKNEELNY